MPPPPSVAGAAQLTVAEASSALALTERGAPGRSTFTVNQELIRPRSKRNVSPPTVTEPFDPVTVRLVIRPPHCSPTCAPFWSVPDRFSRALTARLVKLPMDGYADCSSAAVTSCDHEWLFHDAVDTP